MRKGQKTALVTFGVIAVLVGAATVYYKVKFPYGHSHCCIVQMFGALELYAEDNGGRYPAGESSAEASLSLLYGSNYLDPYTLRGISVREEPVRRTLERGGLLGPDSCGWQYVPGLTRADDPGIAILWCKSALGHNGERTKDGGRQVLFVGRGVEWIPGDKWPAFLGEQQRLLSKRDQRAKAGLPLVDAVIELQDGKRIETVDGSVTISEDSKGPDSSGHGTSSGTGGRVSMVLYHPPLQNGSVTRTIAFSNLISSPVTVTFRDGVPDKTNVVYKMRATQ